MAGELIAAQLVSDAININAMRQAATFTYSPSLVYLSYHVIAAGATGNPDDVFLFNANMPCNSCVMYSILFATAGAGGASADIRNAAAGAGDSLLYSTHPATAAMNSGRLGSTTKYAVKGGSAYLRRSNDNIGGTMLIAWYRYYADSETAGSLAPGQLTAETHSVLDLGNAPAATYGIPYVTLDTLAVGGGGADDVALAAMPKKALLLYSFYQSTVTKAGTVTVRSAPAGGGDALSAALDTNTATIVSGTGTGTTAAAATVPQARRSDSTSSGTLVCFWLPQA